MKNLFIPYYLNEENVKNVYQIAVNRFANLNLKAFNKEIEFKFEVPLSELTCGKISQGNASITVKRENIRANLDVSSKRIIEIYVNLENMLHKNNLLKSITEDNIDDLVAGDLVEFSCIVNKGDTSLEVFNTAKALLEYHQLKTGSDNSKILSWIDSTIKNMKDNKPLKLTTKPLFQNNDTVMLISLCNKSSLYNLECYLGREVSIVGEVTNHNTYLSSEKISSESAIEVDLLFDLLKSDEKYKELAPKLKSILANKIERADTNYIEIIPLIIYL